MLATLGTAQMAAAAELSVNGNFVAEDFNTAAAWLGVDDKYGTASQADDIAVWSDEPPNYGAIPRICQDAAEVGGSAGGVRGSHIEQSVAVAARLISSWVLGTCRLGSWAADPAPNQADPYQFVAPGNGTGQLRFFLGGQWAKLGLAGVS